MFEMRNVFFKFTPDINGVSKNINYIDIKLIILHFF